MSISSFLGNREGALCAFGCSVFFLLGRMDFFSKAVVFMIIYRKHIISIARERKYRMLHIYLGTMEKAIYHPPVYFDNSYEDSWLVNPLGREMIEDVDRSHVISAHLIESPVLGPISPKALSGGVKTLLLLAFDESGEVFNASACGDNCALWILKIAEEKELTINLRHIMNFGEKPFSLEILNTHTVIHSMNEFVEIAGDYV